MFKFLSLLLFQLTLVARDHGYPKWYETLSYLTILLVDTNDNRPEFPDSKTANPYHFYVTENNEKDIKLGNLYEQAWLKSIFNEFRKFFHYL